MAKDFCCGCTMVNDYGTSTVAGVGSSADPFKVTLIDPGFIRPVVRVRRTTDQLNLADGVSTAVSFDSELFDTDAMWAIGSPTRLTINTAGLYLMGGCVSWEANATGVRELTFRANGTTDLDSQDIRPDSGAIRLQQSLSYLWFFQLGEYVELMARQESGGPLDIMTQEVYSAVFWMSFVGKKI